MDRSERLGLTIAAALMALFFAALAYASLGLGITVPTCATNVGPFERGRVVPRGEGRYEVRYDEPGEYRMICRECCGAAHHYMAGKIVVRGGEAAANEPPRVAAAERHGDAEAAGLEEYQEKGCPACHTTDGSPGLGPTLKGVFGRTVTLADGTNVVADDAYVEAAIRDPNAAIVKGYQPVMPKLPLTEDEVRRLVDYLKSLR